MNHKPKSSISIQKIGIHLLVLLGLTLLFAILMYFNADKSGPPPSFLHLTFQSAIGLFISLAPPVYFNLFWLIPYCLERKRYVVYALGMVGVIVFWGIFISYFEPWTDRNWFNEPGEAEGYGTGIAAMIFLMVITTLISIFFRWFEQLAKVQEMERDRLKMELSLLKNQINPHFFFNTLNNLYALSLRQSPETPKVILKLSEMMRYTIYDCNSAQVKLEGEIKYLENYIELQEIRRQNGATVIFEKEIGKSGVQIAPMILIVFVENAFKHGFEQIDDAELRLELSVSERKIHFRVENRFLRIDGENGGGIGLENVKKRLELEYPGCYSLEMDQLDDRFIVNLNIDIAP